MNQTVGCWNAGNQGLCRGGSTAVSKVTGEGGGSEAHRSEFLLSQMLFWKRGYTGVGGPVNCNPKGTAWNQSVSLGSWDQQLQLTL